MCDGGANPIVLCFFLSSSPPPDTAIKHSLGKGFRGTAAMPPSHVLPRISFVYKTSFRVCCPHILRSSVAQAPFDDTYHFIDRRATQSETVRPSFPSRAASPKGWFQARGSIFHSFFFKADRPRSGERRAAAVLLLEQECRMECVSSPRCCLCRALLHSPARLIHRSEASCRKVAITTIKVHRGLSLKLFPLPSSLSLGARRRARLRPTEQPLIASFFMFYSWAVNCILSSSS